MHGKNTPALRAVSLHEKQTKFDVFKEARILLTKFVYTDHN